MIREAIVLAGGKGERLKDVIGELPKPMAPVNGRPFLEYHLDYLDNWGMKRVVLSVGFMKEKIKEHFGNSYKSMELAYSEEDEPLGTGGAIKRAFEHVDGHAAFIFNGDTYFDVNLQRVNDFRYIKETDVVIVLRFEDNVNRYGEVEFDGNNRIIRFAEKTENEGEGYINGGIYLITKAYFNSFDLPEKFSIEKDFFQKYCSEEHFYGIRCFSYFRDIGVPDDYQKAQDEFKRLVY
jgi:D-glycero-alpha-D-manno-heptose 1-phosphate guanylyltransferase